MVLMIATAKVSRKVDNYILLWSSVAGSINPGHSDCVGIARIYRSSVYVSSSGFSRVCLCAFQYHQSVWPCLWFLVASVCLHFKIDYLYVPLLVFSASVSLHFKIFRLYILSSGSSVMSVCLSF